MELGQCRVNLSFFMSPVLLKIFAGFTMDFISTEWWDWLKYVYEVDII